MKPQNSWKAVFGSPLKGAAWPLLAWFSGPVVFFGVLFLLRPGFILELAWANTGLFGPFQLPLVPFRLAFFALPLVIYWFIKLRLKEDPAAVIDLTQLGQWMAGVAAAAAVLWAVIARGHLAEVSSGANAANIQSLFVHQVLLLFLTSVVDVIAASGFAVLAAWLAYPRRRLPKA